LHVIPLSGLTVCRTAVVQEAPPHAEAIWQVLTDCKHLLLDRIRPGASCREIYAAFIAELERNDLPPISFVGHGIGLFLHENPYIGHTPIIGSDADAELEAGTYTQIRLIVGDDNTAVIDGTAHDLTVPSGAQTGIKIPHVFEVTTDTEHELVLEFDPDQSVVDSGGSGYLLKPVIGVDRYGSAR
jgi:Xaa-Pro aminopeptidase